MSCNTCAKSFSLLRKEKGCPGCGFSNCSKCLDNKVYLPKLKAEAKVCAKCKKTIMSNEKKEIEPPDAYYKRIGAMEPQQTHSMNTSATAVQNTTDLEILKRLQKLKEDQIPVPKTTDADIAQRLQKIKGEMPTTSDAELHSRLANLKGVPQFAQSKPVLPTPDLRTEQEQADDLMKQYLEQATIDTKYKDEFDIVMGDIEQRMQRLKDKNASSPENKDKLVENESEDEDEIVRKLIEKAKADSLLESEVSEVAPGCAAANDELPFCEICNEDAQMRCLGCKYLFCRRCFLEHKDDDDGCDRYEPYKPPKGYQY